MLIYHHGLGEWGRPCEGVVWRIRLELAPRLESWFSHFILSSVCLGKLFHLSVLEFPLLKDGYSNSFYFLRVCTCLCVLSELKGFSNCRSRPISGSWDQFNGLTSIKKNRFGIQSNRRYQNALHTVRVVIVFWKLLFPLCIIWKYVYMSVLHCSVKFLPMSHCPKGLKTSKWIQSNQKYVGHLADDSELLVTTVLDPVE